MHNAIKVLIKVCTMSCRQDEKGKAIDLKAEAEQAELDMIKA